MSPEIQGRDYLLCCQVNNGRRSQISEDKSSEQRDETQNNFIQRSKDSKSHLFFTQRISTEPLYNGVYI